MDRKLEVCRRTVQLVRNYERFELRSVFCVWSFLAGYLLQVEFQESDRKVEMHCAALSVNLYHELLYGGD